MRLLLADGAPHAPCSGTDSCRGWAGSRQQGVIQQRAARPPQPLHSRRPRVALGGCAYPTHRPRDFFIRTSRNFFIRISVRARTPSCTASALYHRSCPQHPVCVRSQNVLLQCRDCRWGGKDRWVSRGCLHRTNTGKGGVVWHGAAVTAALELPVESPAGVQFFWKRS